MVPTSWAKLENDMFELKLEPAHLNHTILRMVRRLPVLCVGCEFADSLAVRELIKESLIAAFPGREVKWCGFPHQFEVAGVGRVSSINEVLDDGMSLSIRWSMEPASDEWWWSKMSD